MGDACRCGWNGQGGHPCHGQAYECRKPARERFYEPHKRYSLAGVQTKFSMSQTWACDECWATFLPRVKRDNSE